MSGGKVASHPMSTDFPSALCFLFHFHLDRSAFRGDTNGDNSRSAVCLSVTKYGPWSSWGRCSALGRLSVFSVGEKKEQKCVRLLGLLHPLHKIFSWYFFITGFHDWWEGFVCICNENATMVQLFEPVTYVGSVGCGDGINHLGYGSGSTRRLFCCVDGQGFGNLQYLHRDTWPIIMYYKTFICIW